MKDVSKEESLLQGDVSDVRINPTSARTTELNNVSKIKAEKEEEEETIKLTPYRFIIVIVYFFLNFINGMHWVTFASIAEKFGKFYHLNHFSVDLFSLLYMIVYPIGCIPEAYLIDNISMQIGLIISASLIILGSLLKIFINTSMAYAYIGQFLTAVFQPAILNSPGKIAATWFDENSRNLVTSICCVSNTIGIMIGYLLHTFSIEDNIVNPKMFRDSFEDYLLLEFIITTVFCVIFIFLMRNKPKYSPSISKKKHEIMKLKEGIKKLMSNKDFVKLLISLTCVVGFINIFGTIFNSYMAMYKISDKSATYTAAASNLFGIVTALVVGAIIDKFKKYKLSLSICNIISLIFFAITIILMETVDKDKLPTVSFVCYTLIIGSAVPIYTSGMDFICEITYPVGESISEGIIMSCNQILGCLGILFCDCLRTYFKEYKFLTNLFCIVLFVISLISLLLIKTDLVRSKQDIKNEEENLPEVEADEEDESLIDTKNKKD